MPEDIKSVLAERGVNQGEFTTLTDEVIGSSDIIYVTRVQKERFQDLKDYEAVKNAFVVDANTLKKVRISCEVRYDISEFLYILCVKLRAEKIHPCITSFF